MAQTVIFDIAGQLQDMADKLGTSASFLSAFEAQAAETGASLQDINQALFFMNNSIGEAARGNEEVIDSFRRLNIDIEDLKRLSPEEQFYLISQRISELQTSFERTEAARNIFGRGVSNLLPIIQQGGDKIREMNEALVAQGLALSPENVAKLDQLGDAIGRTSIRIRNELINAVADGIRALEQLFGVADDLSSADLRKQIERKQALIDSLPATDPVFPGMGGKPGPLGPRALAEKQLAELKNQLDVQNTLEAMRAARAETQRLAANTASASAARSGTTRSAGSPAREELRRICDSLNDERGTGGQTKLARLLGWDSSTVRRKLSGASRITRSDELAVRAAAGIDSCGDSSLPRTHGS